MTRRRAPAPVFSGSHWEIRRRIIIGTLLFCAGEVIYLTGWGQDTDLAGTIASGVLLLAGSTIGAYVFGAAWDDRNTMVFGRVLGRRRGAPSDSSDNPPEDGPPT
ncbi:hypothetical protein V5G24_04065 [Xanthobacter sp. VTT E-85241]|uniref:hypothetical protein n=1 Tax=Roseixanthobacter finlandensis TaxID=3119922 RepID=UPI003727E554